MSFLLERWWGALNSTGKQHFWTMYESDGDCADDEPVSSICGLHRKRAEIKKAQKQPAFPYSGVCQHCRHGHMLRYYYYECGGQEKR